MSHYRYLLGPIRFLGHDLYEVQDVAPDGILRMGAAGTPSTAMAALEAELAGEGLADDDWRAAPGLIEALGLPAERAGKPDAAQRRAMLAGVMFRSSAGEFWNVENRATMEGILAALAKFTRRARTLPPGQSFPYRATLDGTRRATLYPVISRGEDTATLTLVFTEDSLRQLYDAALGGGTKGEEIDITVLHLDLDKGWVAQAMEEAFGVGFAPLLFERVAGKRQPITERTAQVLAVCAAACPDRFGMDRSGRAELDTPTDELTCKLEPLAL